MRAPSRHEPAIALSPANRFAAALVVLVSLLMPPGLYGTIAFTNISSDMDADARVAAETVQHLIRTSSGRWQDNTNALDAIAAGWYHFDEPVGFERLRIADRDGRTLTAIGATPVWPRTVRAAPLTERGEPAGKVEIERSLRPAILVTALLAVFGLGLAAVSFITFHLVPLRTLRQQNAVLRQREAQLGFAETTLRAATEGSLDAILIVDEEGRIVSYTQRFIDLWNVPAELVRSGDDVPVLASVMAQVRNPIAYRARVDYLYAHPDEESRDRIETRDGRVIDRYTRTLFGPDRRNLGRIWFFRDVTGQERAAAALKESEARFRAIFDGVRDGISLADPETHVLWLGNAGISRMLGYTPEELSGMPIAQVHPAEALPAVLDAFEKQARREMDLAPGLPLKRKDGSVFYADINSTPVKIGDKTYLLGVFRDSTERKAIEDKLIFANTLLQAEIEAAPDAVLAVHSDLKTASFNRNFLDMFDIPAALEGQQDADAILAASLPRLSDPDAYWADVRALRADPDRRIGAREATLKNGHSIEYNGATIRGPGGQALGRIWFFRDITERKRAEFELARSEARFRAMYDAARDGIGLVDLKTHRMVNANAFFCEMLGYDEAEIPSVSVEMLHPPEALAACMVEFARHARGETQVATDLPVIRKDGSIFYADITTARLDVGGEQQMLGIFRDVSVRRQAEEAVRKSEEKYRNLVESATDFVWEIDADNRYTYYSPSARQYLGYDPAELIGKTPFDLMAPEEAARVAALFAPIMAAHAPFSMVENTVRTKDGTPVVMETSGVPIFDKDGAYRGYRGIARDVTKRKVAEDELQKRDALLHAIAASATALVTAPSLDDAISRALATVSEALEADRVLVMERSSDPKAPPTLRYVWHSPTAGVVVDDDTFKTPLISSAPLLAWPAQLSGGEMLTLYRSSAPPEFAEFLDTLGIHSMLVVPISVDGKYWGQIAFDACTTERVWRNYETEILSTLAELIGTVIQRERYVSEIANANRIVQNTPTILYRLRGAPSLPMIYVSQNIRLFGYEPAVLTEAPLLYQNLIHPDDIAAVREKSAKALDTGAASGSYEFRLLTGRGDYRWVENRFTPIRDANGRLVEVEGLLIDITDRKGAEEKIALLARTDPLTGLANRNTFVERLRQFFVAARRGGPGFALHYVDLDRFKEINDTLGHPIGDRFLIEAANRLKGSVREIDLVGRLGGDEFAILQADVSDTTDAGALAAKLQARLAEPMMIEGNLLRGTVSIGIAIFGPTTPAPEALLAQADVALYRAKEEGRDQYRFHTETLDVEVREQVQLVGELREALSNGEFELYYQPQVELASGRVVGMEALVRWHHPTRGLLPASVFIPIAERAGVVVELGRWVLDGACAQMHTWQQEGIAPPVIAVNVSAAEIKSADEYLDAVRTALEKWQLQPQAIELDVTESTLARATLAQNDVLERLQQLGVNISIDDFGTKYSSLDYLRVYRINRLKIPPRLTTAAARDSESAAMVRAIVGIARELNIDVVAQGIENESQWAFLTATSPATKVQGYFYSEPVSPEHAEELLRQHRISPSQTATTRS